MKSSRKFKIDKQRRHVEDAVYYHVYLFYLSLLERQRHSPTHTIDDLPSIEEILESRIEVKMRFSPMEVKAYKSRRRRLRKTEDPPPPPSPRASSSYIPPSPRSLLQATTSAYNIPQGSIPMFYIPPHLSGGIIPEGIAPPLEEPQLSSPAVEHLNDEPEEPQGGEVIPPPPPPPPLPPRAEASSSTSRGSRTSKPQHRPRVKSIMGELWKKVRKHKEKPDHMAGVQIESGKVKNIIEQLDAQKSE